VEPPVRAEHPPGASVEAELVPGHAQTTAPAGELHGKRRGMSLSLIFVLIATLAVLAAIAAPAVQAIAAGEPTSPPVIFTCILLGVAVGSIAGAAHFHTIEGFLWGVPIGFIMGIFAALVAFTPFDRVEHAVLPAMLGAVVIVVAGAIIRISRHSSYAGRDEEQRNPFDEP